MANDQSPHLSLAGAARARGRHRPRTAAPRAETPVHGRRVPAAAATVTAISAISLLQETGGRGSNPIQYRNPSGQETGSGRMRRRCYKGEGEGEGEGDGIMTRMSAAVAAALSIGWGAGMGGGLVLLSALPSASPQASTSGYLYLYTSLHLYSSFIAQEKKLYSSLCDVPF